MPKIINRKDIDLSPKFNAFDYQIEAFEFISGKEYAAIFHEQGLGKTKIAIDICLGWLASDIVDTVLIVTKKTLILNWEREVKNHSHISPKILGRSSRSDFYVLNGPARVILAHYEVVKKEKKRLNLFLKTRRVGVILDESHKIKNPNSGLAEAFFELSGLFNRRIIMSGTPIANRPYDIWSQIKFLDGGMSLGADFEEFKSKYDFDKKLAESEDEKSRYAQLLKELNDCIKEFSIRETKNGSSIELPNKIIKTIITEWDPLQYDKYNSIRKELKLVILKDGDIKIDETESVLKRLLRLVQVTSNPALIDDSYKNIPGKFSSLLELLTEIRNKNEKSIIWTSFKDNALWLKNNLKEYRPSVVTGDMSMEQRDREVVRFKEKKDVHVLIATPGAAKEGLTLTEANHAIFYDRTFSLDDYLQAQDRIHRISQTKECFVYKFLMEDSIDYWIDCLIEEKVLAAKLGQGDISVNEYEEKAEFNFFKLLEDILEVREDD